MLVGPVGDGADAVGAAGCEADELACPTADETMYSGGMPKPVAGFHPIENPVMKPTCACVAIGVEFVYNGAN